MKSKFKLSDKQVLELQDFLKNTKDKLEHTRALAILNKHNGMTAEQIADNLHVTTVAVFNWCKRYKEYGIDGIRRRKPSGRPPIVKSIAKKMIPEILKNDPQAFGFLKSRWVVRDIAKVLNEEEGIKIGYRYVCYILHELGFTHKRPKLSIDSNDPNYYKKRKDAMNYKQASGMLFKKRY